MFPIKETSDDADQKKIQCVDLKFVNAEHFSAWLDVQLEDLVSKYGEFETRTSIRNFLKRS